MSESTENQEIPDAMRVAWDRTLKELENVIRPQFFQSFILTIKLLQAKETTLVLGFPEKFYRDWVHDHYSATIQEKFDEACGQNFKLEFAIEPRPSGRVEHRNSVLPPLDENSRVSASVPVTPPITIQPVRASNRSTLSANSTLNIKYGFETFVVGTSNQFAHAAAFQVSEMPGRHYNPLFIYGDVGLGKTHLLNAVGLKIQEKFPSLRVHYTTFEKFTNHMIESIRFEKMEEFRERYRKNVDVLIIDDIQFISGKERTQEEFFHTFNALYELHKQIVLSSDRPPREIEGLEDRLRSRFEMGLIVDISPPEMETRVAIIFKKAEMDGINISHDVAFHLAKLYRSNIRELEGALLKLSAFASLTSSEISLELAKKVLKEEAPEFAQFHYDPEEIMKAVARHYQVSLADLKSDRKNRQLALPRQLAMYLCRKYSHLSLPDIGSLFGGKNHTTVLHAIRKISKTTATDAMLKDSMSKLEAGLRETSV
jgi:chromosomal replication initiator protein